MDRETAFPPVLDDTFVSIVDLALISGPVGACPCTVQIVYGCIVYLSCKLPSDDICIAVAFQSQLDKTFSPDCSTELSLSLGG